MYNTMKEFVKEETTRYLTSKVVDILEVFLGVSPTGGDSIKAIYNHMF